MLILTNRVRLDARLFPVLVLKFLDLYAQFNLSSLATNGTHENQRPSYQL